MATNVVVSLLQYNGGLLPDIILLTLRDYIVGEPFWYHMKSFCPYSQCSHLIFLTIFPLNEGGCSEGLDALL